MKKQQSSIDGFIPRQRISPVEHQAAIPDRYVDTSRRTELTAAKSTQPLHATSTSAPLGKQQLDESLKAIDQPIDTKGKKQKKSKQPKSSRRKIIRRIILIIIVALIGIGGYMVYKFAHNSSKVLGGNIFGIIQKKPLKADANGRTNIAIFGTSEDDYEGGKQHEGAHLTDSIMVLSVDQKKYDAYMVSIPRDLWVKYGAACVAGYEGKINALYQCYSDDGKKEKEKDGAEQLKSKLSEVTGLDIQYYTHVNYSVVREAVDAVGGVSVNIQGTGQYGSQGILDRNFDWKCGYKCYYVKYPNGPTPNMDGEHALALARARGEGIQTYGLVNANYDREVNQQKILKALQQKAMSAGTLADIGKVSKLMDALGENLRTNFDTTEIQTLMDIGSKIKDTNIKSLSLVDEKEPATTTGNVGGQSIVRAVSGMYDYSSIKKYITKRINADPATSEGAKIAVYNGSGVVGAAKTEADKLEEKGFEISSMANAPAGEYGNYRVYQRTKNKPLTGARLEAMYGAKPLTTEAPFQVDTTADYILVVGKSTSTNAQ